MRDIKSVSRTFTPGVSYYIVVLVLKYSISYSHLRVCQEGISAIKKKI